MDKNLVKKKVKNLVEGYKIVFPEDYKAVVTWIDTNRRIQENEFASLKQDNGMLHRAIYELPEALSVSIENELDGEQLAYFKTKECARWFAKTFPEFSLAQKI